MDITASVLAYAKAEPPEDVRAVMRLSLLDWAACGIVGHRDGAFDSWAATLQALGPATRFDGRGGALAEAALVNGTLSHALDYDDTHFAHIGHPSVAVLPAALAMAEGQGASLAQMVDAALVGAEASIAVGLWLGRDHYELGFHQTATAGAFGATVASGRLLGLSDSQMRHALGLCSTMASGLKSQFGTMGKPLNAGLAARTGIEAALWAQAGMTSASDGLAAPLGFGASHHGTGADVPFVWRMGSVSHKFHACCHGLHAALEAVRGIDLSAAEQITVHTHPRWMTVCNQPSPDTGLGAKFSYRHVLAMAAHGSDTGDVGAFTDRCAQDPTLVAWRDRVQVQPDHGLTEMQARVVVDGVEHMHDLDAPLPLHTRRARIHAKARALVGARANKIAQAIEDDDVPRFAQLLAP
ncbi:MmgE/PrpD family protein [Tateyamaria omphalii]|uniref:2-methylcitrate dehydratase n=1 Tax=Tateyamaria omphalii TaxID=299262 RepID=A0A1P8MU34_9RHOB|nr:MmgE/PrpD family protein [Tateyamaria omphalii]APX11600.1 2-methylcitrate dehydratase [Tateyamaria omphalii]